MRHGPCQISNFRKTIIPEIFLAMVYTPNKPHRRGFDHFTGVLTGGTDFYGHRKCFKSKKFGLQCGYDYRESFSDKKREDIRRDLKGVYSNDIIVNGKLIIFQPLGGAKGNIQFQIHALNSKIFKIPEFNLNIQEFEKVWRTGKIKIRQIRFSRIFRFNQHSNQCKHLLNIRNFTAWGSTDVLVKVQLYISNALRVLFSMRISHLINLCHEKNHGPLEKPYWR